MGLTMTIEKLVFLPGALSKVKEAEKEVNLKMVLSFSELS